MSHSERAHALLSASGAHRWMTCPPSARMEEQFPDTTSDAAKEGTLAHELAELKLRNYFYTVEFGKRKLTAAINKLKKDPLWKDEMQGYTEDYLDYIRSTALSLKTEPYVAIEKQVDLSAYIPEGFGTADCILISGSALHVIDFKYGKSPNGRVDAEQNPQMMLYALGAYDAYRFLYPIQTIKLSIVQPRLPDGISEWELDLKDLLKFGETVKERAALAIKGEGDPFPEDRACQFCRARARCPARAKKNAELAFAVGKMPPLLTNEEVGSYLKQGLDVASWLSDLKDYALAECLAGREVPGWKAVEGRGSRAWADMDAAFSAIVKSKIIDEKMLWKREPLSAPQVEQLLGKKTFGEIAGDYVVKNPGKPALVEQSDKRKPVTNRVTAAEAFQATEG